MPDATYNLSGGFKPTMKRFADLDGPDFFPTPRWATFALTENEKLNGQNPNIRRPVIAGTSRLSHARASRPCEAHAVRSEGWK